jgi:4-hydroxy-2-oxoheptanedioate aldolase
MSSGASTIDKGVEPVKPEDVAKLGMRAYRAPSLFQPHRMREAIKDAHDGKIPPLMGYFMGLPSTAMAKVIAQFGFDVVWIDWAHSAMSVETMTQVSTPKSLTDQS